MHVLPTPTGVSIDCPRFEPHYDASETCMLEVEMRSYGNLLGLDGYLHNGSDSLFQTRASGTFVCLARS